LYKQVINTFKPCVCLAAKGNNSFITKDDSAEHG